MTDDDATPITVAPGYLGDATKWCFWFSEYPDEGSFGPYDDADATISAVAGYAVETGTTMKVVRVLTLDEADLHYKVQ